MVVEARRVLVLLAGMGLMGLPEWSALPLQGQAGSVTQPSGADAALRQPAPQEPVQSVAPSAAATPSDPASENVAGERSLPDVAALMHDVETNQRAAEAIEKDYLYRSLVTEQQLDSHGGLKKTETREFEVFWENGVPVGRLVKKDGKELSAEEQKKENERIDKDSEKAKERRQKVDEEGKESDARGHELMTASRALELGSFTNPRRVQLNGRDTIVADYAGDPKAKTRTKFEEVVRDMMGTVWVDEQDRVLVKAEGHFVNNFKIGGGLVANIQKGTSFGMEQRKVNGEVWLPARFEGQGSARALLFLGFNGRVEAVESDYRKFKATSKIVPVESPGTPASVPK
ncbi:hypothetical protein RBB79_04935 [Tunturiibacter empetritectus]|uniref:Uncharacterized protein n=1 Tax=Tunturiibacter lichenicola TaxID=2051959 RepID=A0A852V7G7_9BACT|nr:hypothetical protein [Edaphobacter lichenicola]NYF88863.1 hypothetical protein [Edaphobacter lichenicola]